MIYAMPVLIVMMLGYMFWSSTFRLRRDRLLAIKNSDRSGTILSRRHRIRANLTRVFVAPQQKLECETELLAALDGRLREGQEHVSR